MSTAHVRLFNAALDESEEGAIILRGRLDPETLDSILEDDYQREVLPVTTINQIMKGFDPGGSVPDIDLGMRGTRTTDRTTTNNGEVYTLIDDVFVIDGKQRITAARKYRLLGKTPRLGAIVHFNTSRKWELERFKILNSERVKVSGNIHLRNLRDDYECLTTLYNMTESDNNFAMKSRICWQQTKQRMHLLTATTFLKSVSLLHSHLGTGLRHLSSGEVLGESLDKVLKSIGKNIFRENVRTFYQLIEDCWGIRTVTYSGAPHMKNTFIFSLCRVLSEYVVFWRENKLFIEMDLVRKFKSFPIQDPTVQQLAGSSGQAGKVLYALMVDHLNKGKRSKKLKPRNKIQPELDIELPILES